MTNQEQKVIDEANRVLDLAKNKAFAQDVARQVGYSVIAALKPIFAEVNKTTKEAVCQYVEEIRKIKLVPPSVSVKPTDIIVEKQNLPPINLEAPKIPEIKIPKIEIPEIKFSTEKIEQAILKAFSKVRIPAPQIEIKEREIPKEIEVKGIAGYFKTLGKAFTGKLNVGLEEIDQENPLHVVLVDERGKYYRPGGGGMVIRRGEKTNIEEIDLSSQCNGSRTTFSLGKTVDSIILVNLNGTLTAHTLNSTKTQITISFTPDSGEELKVVAII